MTVVGSAGHEDVGDVGDEGDWACVDHEGVMHVLPVGERHLTKDCHCRPKIEILPCGCLMHVHAAFDGRISGDVHKVVRQ